MSLESCAFNTLDTLRITVLHSKGLGPLVPMPKLPGLSGATAAELDSLRSTLGAAADVGALIALKSLN